MRSFAGTPSASVTAIGSSRSTRVQAPTRSSTSARPMRVISACHSRPSSPLKRATASPRLQPPHLQVARLGRRQAPALRQARRGGRERGAATSERHPAAHWRRPRRAARARRQNRDPRRAPRAAALVLRHQRSARANHGKLSSCGSSRMNMRPTSAVPSTLATMMSRDALLGVAFADQPKRRDLERKEKRRRRHEQEQREVARRGDDTKLEPGDRGPLGDPGGHRGERPPAPFLDEEDDRQQAEGQALQQPPQADDDLHDEAGRRSGRPGLRRRRASCALRRPSLRPCARGSGRSCDARLRAAPRSFRPSRRRASG